MTSYNNLEKVEMKENKIKNPITGRWISIGAPTYKKLVRDKILNIDFYEKNNVIYAGNNAREVFENMNKNNLNIPSGKTVYVRNNKILTRNKRISKKDLEVKSKELALEIYREQPHLFVGLTPKECKMVIQQEIHKKMVSDKPSSIKTQMSYIIDNVSTDEDLSDTEDESEYESEDGEEIPDKGQVPKGQENIHELLSESEEGEEGDPLNPIEEISNAVEEMGLE